MLPLGVLLLGIQGSTTRLTVYGDVSDRRSYRVDDLRRVFAGEIKEIDFTEKGKWGMPTLFRWPL